MMLKRNQSARGAFPRWPPTIALTGRGKCRHDLPGADRPPVAIVLIVEDEPFIRQVAEWTIGDLGHATLMADDMASALDHLDGQQPIDALFVDIHLYAESQGGYEIARRAVGMRPELRVLYTSGTSLCTDMTDRFIAGAAFIQKPYTTAQLEHSIELLLH